MPGLRWSAGEELRLAWLYGQVGVDGLAAALGRSPRAVEAHASRLGLRSTQGRLSARATALRLGVSQPTVVKAARALELRRKPRASARKLGGRGERWWQIDEGDLARVWTWIAAHCRIGR